MNQTAIRKLVRLSCVRYYTVSHTEMLQCLLYAWLQALWVSQWGIWYCWSYSYKPCWYTIPLRFPDTDFIFKWRGRLMSSDGIHGPSMFVFMSNYQPAYQCPPRLIHRQFRLIVSYWETVWKATLNQSEWALHTCSVHPANGVAKNYAVAEKSCSIVVFLGEDSFQVIGLKWWMFVEAGHPPSTLGLNSLNCHGFEKIRIPFKEESFKLHGLGLMCCKFIGPTCRRIAVSWICKPLLFWNFLTVQLTLILCV